MLDFIKAEIKELWDRLHGALSQHHETILSQLNQRTKEMTTDIADVKAHIATLAAAVQAGNDKTDLLITGNTALRDQITALQAQVQSGTPASSDDLQSLVNSVDDITALVNAQSSKDDAALAPAPSAPVASPAEPVAAGPEVPVSGSGAMVDGTTAPTTIETI